MKTHLLALLLLPLLLTSCFSEGFYDDLNATPEISSTANVSVTDTLKIGKLKNINEDVHFDFPVSVSDANSNLLTLTLSADDNILVTNDMGELIPKIYDLNDRYNSGTSRRLFRLVPKEPGDYTVTATVTDKFSKSAELSKQLHIFDNLPPKCAVTDSYYIVDQITHQIYVDIRASFDQDAAYGGSIATYHALYHYTWDDTPSVMGPWAVDDYTPGKFRIADFIWETIGYIEAWVVDNEGTESAHIRIDPAFRQ